MNRSKLLALAICSLVIFAPLLQAGAQGITGGQPGTMMEQPRMMAEGEVRKVDKGAGKLTIKHGAIPSMDMPPMTMVYRVKDPAMLERVKAGDKVMFAAENLGGAFTVTKIEAAR